MVLTAAHCVGAFPEGFPVRVGSIHRNNGGVQSNIKRRIPHPQYNAQGKNEYDIMLVELEEPIQNVSFVELNTDPDYPASYPRFGIGAPLQIMGFGATAEKGIGSQTMKETKVNYVKNDDCRRLYRLVDPIMMCAGTKQGGTCGSDLKTVRCLNFCRLRCNLSPQGKTHAKVTLVGP